MDLSKTPPSKNFVDLSYLGPMYGNLLQAFANKQTREAHTFEDSPANGGYDKWLRNEFNKLSPAEVKMMHENGMTLDDLYVLRNLHYYKNNQPLP